MPGPLTYAAIAMMARDRVREIRDALRIKIASGRTVRDVERRVLHLAEQAHAMMSVDEPSVPAPLQLYGPPLGDKVSKLLLVGAIGPELPAYAAMFHRGQGWLRDTLHKGTPDLHQERVITESANLPLQIWQRAQQRIAGESDEKKRKSRLRRMRAYTLGHLCHVAADVVSSPFIDDVTSHLGTATRAKLTREAAVGAIEVEVSRALFLRGTDTRGSEWGNWWPRRGELPDELFEAWIEALEALYGSGAVRPGFGAFEAQRGEDDPPALSTALLKDGYDTFRNVVQTGSAWDLLDWMGALAPMFVPALAAMPMMALMPQGKNRFLDPKPEGYDAKIATYEMMVFPFMVSAILPLAVTLGVSFSYLGVGDAVIFGWVNAAVWLVAAVAFFTSLGGAGAERWIPLFVVPTLLSIAHIVFTLARGGSDNEHWRLAFSSILHLGLAGVFVLLFWGFLHEGVEVLDGHGEAGTFVWQFFVWLLILGALWIGIALLMRYLGGGQLPADEASQFVTGRRHHVQLFDDTTLFARNPGVSPTLADLHYPSGRRGLMKIWWTGNGAPTIRSTRDTLLFDFGGGTVRTVRAPLAPITLADYAKFLERTVKDGANATGLKTELLHVADDYVLPSGMVFADEGDTATTETAHTAAAAVARGLTAADPYVLHHAHKQHQSVRYDRRGPDESENRAQRVVGQGTVNSAGVVVTAVAAPNTTPLTRMFRPGDLFEAPQGSGTRRVVVSVDSDTRLTVSTPFAPVLAGATFERAAQDRRNDLALPPAVLVYSHHSEDNDLTLLGGLAGAFLKPGDTIRVLAAGGNQTRVVVEVINDNHLTLSSPLSPRVTPAGVNVVRVGEAAEHLHAYVASADDHLESDGPPLMNDAADLAALLCLAGASHMVEDPTKANRVYQVFRNWNLDRRRVNEWKTLVIGGAESEKRGDPAGADPAMPPVDANWFLRTPRGQSTAESMGWVPLLRSWIDMAKRPEADAQSTAPFRAGRPSNLALSRGMAWLLDLADPVP